MAKKEKEKEWGPAAVVKEMLADFQSQEARQRAALYAIQQQREQAERNEAAAHDAECRIQGALVALNHLQQKIEGMKPQPKPEPEEPEPEEPEGEQPQSDA